MDKFNTLYRPVGLQEMELIPLSSAAWYASHMVLSFEALVGFWRKRLLWLEDVTLTARLHASHPRLPTSILTAPPNPIDSGDVQM